MPNIAVVWDFDKTLTPEDSTTKVVEFLTGDNGADFWQWIHSLRGDETNSKDWEHVLASDAPIWMYTLSEFAMARGYPLNAEFFREYILKLVSLYPGVVDFMKEIKSLQESEPFKSLGLEIHHFIVSAGLKELVEQYFPEGIATWVFGCRYTIVAHEEDKPKSIPVYCMDETMKTRSLFEISKGSFKAKENHVNKRVEKKDLWCPFENMIYIGDGPTDVPALSLTRQRGGMGVIVFNPDADLKETSKRIKSMRLDKRADIITPALYSLDGELFEFIRTRIIQIKQRYEAERIDVN
jgi:2-hydroxy-3-keto-5-methylthiopentenyl-1-phosphate phosphatase